MTDNKPPVQQKKQRLKTRWQIPKSLDAKVIVRTQQGARDGRKEASEQCWQGYLINIGESGAQILVEAVCWEQFYANPNVMLQFDISLCETEVIGQVRYILPDEQDNSIKLGIEFSESELHADTKQLIHRISALSGNCPECKFDECPSL
ncbi:MAG: PilZ domain-containing protein [Planctomycetota bacterium]|jgi:hypothetical protein